MSEKLKNLTKHPPLWLNNKTEFERFECASKELDELIKKGIVPKKEYNLLTSVEKHLPILHFNVPKPIEFEIGNSIKQG